MPRFFVGINDMMGTKVSAAKILNGVTGGIQKSISIRFELRYHISPLHRP